VPVAHIKIGATSATGDVSTVTSPRVLKAMTTADLKDRIHAFPKLLTPGTDDTLHSVHSYEILQALVDHSNRMHAVDEEYVALNDGDKVYQGKSSSELAEAFKAYATEHKNEPLSQKFATSVFASASESGRLSSLAAGGGASAILSSHETSGVTFLQVDQYSWSILLRSMQWAKVLYSIIWMASGLLLLFFGLASFYWLTKWRLQHHHSSDNVALVSALPILKQGHPRQKASGRKGRRAIIGGGVGGLLVGFLGVSYTVALIHNTLSVEHGRRPLPASAFFAVWFVSGLIGACLCGHFSLMSRMVTALLGAASFVVILMAVFSIRLLLVRVTLLSIFAVFFVVPLIQPHAKQLQMLLLNACTSFIGIVTFLNGVALVSPSVEQSSAWVDLWTLLFVGNKYIDQSQLTSIWQSSVFKGFAAASVIGAVVGFVFEWLFHRQCGNDPDADWNQYLGNYTKQFETTNPKLYDDPAIRTDSGASPRAGMFEPAPSAWQKMVDFFDSDHSRPAHYGNLSGDDSYSLATSQTKSTSPLTEKIRKKRSDRSSLTLRDQPARFTPLSKIDREDEFDDASSQESDIEEEQ
jgi:hypothetical protein